MNHFSQFKLNEQLIQALDSLGYTEPTPVQQQVILPMLQGKDILVQAKTGSGKTAAFALPVCQRTSLLQREVQTLILAPTRELATQIKEEIDHLSLYQRLHSVALVGRQPMKEQKLQLKQRVQIVVGTPGRVLDLIDQGSLDVSHIQTLVLDEADQMFSLGLIDTVLDIIDLLPKQRQTALFSATLNDKIEELVDLSLDHPQFIALDEPQKTAETIESLICHCTPEGKKDALVELLSNIDGQSMLIFCATHENTEYVTHELLRHDLPVDTLHGGMEQDDRFAVLRDFKLGKTRILVATDVAARGIDVEGLTHVIHWDLPGSLEQYIHRSGRSGRNQHKGVAISMASNVRHDEILNRLHEEGQVQFKEVPDSWKQFNRSGIQKLQTEALVKVDKAAQLKSDKDVLVIRAGKKDKLRPTDIVGALCQEGGLSAEQIGVIDIRDQMSFVSLIQTDIRSILKNKEMTIKGKKRRLERARASSLQ